MDMEQYKVEVGSMVFDSADPDCMLIVETACGRQYAFIQCIDTGVNGAARWKKRYWGPFNWSDHAGSVQHIMESGGKWPKLPEAQA
jgi:hypothetical protein